MSWFGIAIIGPFLWSVCNHIDKFLIEKYFKARSIGSLVMFSSLVGLVITPIIFIFKPNVFEIDPYFVFLIFISSVTYIIFVWSYLKALEQEEASIVVPFFQLIPVLALLFGYIILGETISQLQVFAMLLIVAGASVLSFEVDEENKFKLRRRTVWFMILSSIAAALDSVLFKYVILEEDFWVSYFWSLIWVGVIGLAIFLFFDLYRKDFLYIVKNNSKKIFSLNILNEILTLIGNSVTSFATLLAPVALVLLTNAYQPVFVLIIGIFLTIFFPKIAVEKIKLRHIIQKVLVIGIMLIGTYLLFV